VKPLMGLHSNGELLALPANIRLSWKVANPLAYYDTETITAIFFILQVTRDSNIKHFTTVILLYCNKQECLSQLYTSTLD
jgi:hypothetical protein